MKVTSVLCLLIIGMITCEDKGVVRLVVRVGVDVVLPCSLGPDKNIEPALFDWMKGRQEVFLYNDGSCYSGDPQFKGRVSHFPGKLKNGNASIIVRNIQLSDSGNYSCYFPHLQQQRFYVELFVGASAKPRIMILNITEDRALLHCEVHGAFPKPEISWIDSNGTVLPAKEKFDYSDGLQHPPALTLQTNVTKTGIFRCRVAQQELNHIIEVPISTHIPCDKTATGSNGLHVVFPVSLTVVVLGLVAGLILYWVHRKRSMRDRRDPTTISAMRHIVAETHDANIPHNDKQPDMACDSDFDSDCDYDSGSGVSSLRASNLLTRDSDCDSGI